MAQPYHHSYWFNRFGRQSYTARGSDAREAGQQVNLVDRMVAIERAADEAGYPLTDMHREALTMIGRALLKLERDGAAPGHPVALEGSANSIFMLAGAELELGLLMKQKGGEDPRPDENVAYHLFDYIKASLLDLMEQVTVNAEYFQRYGENVQGDLQAIIEAVIACEMEEMPQLKQLVSDFLHVLEYQCFVRNDFSKIENGEAILRLRVYRDASEISFAPGYHAFNLMPAILGCLHRFPGFPDYFYGMDATASTSDIQDMGETVELRFNHGDPLTTILHLFEMVAHIRKEFAVLDQYTDHPAILLYGTHANNSSWFQQADDHYQLTKYRAGRDIASSQYAVLLAMLPLLVGDSPSMSAGGDVLDAMEWIAANEIVAKGEYQLEKDLEGLKNGGATQGGVLHKEFHGLTEIREALTSSRQGYNPLSVIFQMAASVIGLKQYIDHPEPARWDVEALVVRDEAGARLAMLQSLLLLTSDSFMELIGIHGDEQVAAYQQALSGHTGVDIVALQAGDLQVQAEADAMLASLANIRE